MKHSQYILALDQGTTSSRAIIINRNGEIVSSCLRSFKQYFPKPGWVEHDASEIWYTQYSAITEALAKADLTGKDIACMGITNQRETTILWDRDTSEPICKAIVWQDRRTADYCEELKRGDYGGMIREKTGLIIDAYFSATKIKWILDNVPGARMKASKGKLCFGTVDSWLIWKLSNGKVHCTDVSNASRTMLFNIHTLKWDKELLKLFDIPASILPEVKSNSEFFCETASDKYPAGVPITGVAGDQQAALFGQLCIEPGMVKTTYGTGCFVVMNTGDKPVYSNNGMLTTIGWKIGKQVTYALEGSVFVGGALVQWLRDEVKMVQSAHETEKIALSVKDNDGVYFVPALTGLGAPYWDQYARGAIIGITRGTTTAHIIRASLEGIAYQVYDVVKAMESDLEEANLGNCTEMRVDGGAVENNFLMQFQADISRISVIRPKNLETTALGAAFLAGLGCGYWKDIYEIRSSTLFERRFEPYIGQNAANTLLERWHDAVSRSRNWENQTI